MDEDDGLIDPILPVAGIEEVTEFSHLFCSKAKHNLSEDHLWISVASRPRRSNFTRLQRLACCFLVLFTTMIANAMFYGVAERNNENDFVLQFGPFLVSASVILVSIYGSLVVFPINLIVVHLFRKSRPKHFISEEKKKASSTKQAMVTFLRKKYWFSHRVTYLAWALTILVNLASGLFIILYALDWGEEKANSWLSSLVLSTIQSVIIVQPFKVSTFVTTCWFLHTKVPTQVMFLAAVVALVFKTLDDDEEDEEEQNERRSAIEAQENTRMGEDEDTFRLDPVFMLGTSHFIHVM